METDMLTHRGERRSEPRTAVEFRCWVVENAGEVRRFAHLTDLSEAGALVRTALPPASGSLITLSLRLGDLRPRDQDPAAAPAPWQDAEAVVVWAIDGVRGRGGIMGVRFVAAPGGPNGD